MVPVLAVNGVCFNYRRTFCNSYSKLKKHDYFVSKRSIEEIEMFQIKIILNYSMSKGEKLKVFF